MSDIVINGKTYKNVETISVNNTSGKKVTYSENSSTSSSSTLFDISSINGTYILPSNNDIWDATTALIICINENSLYSDILNYGIAGYDEGVSIDFEYFSIGSNEQHYFIYPSGADTIIGFHIPNEAMAFEYKVEILPDGIELTPLRDNLHFSLYGHYVDWGNGDVELSADTLRLYKLESHTLEGNYDPDEIETFKENGYNFEWVED